jgi:hypothetical protein
MRRGSIRRWMLAIALFGLDLWHLQGWFAITNWWGFLGLLYVMVLAAWVGWLVVPGMLGRFFGGFGVTGLLLWLTVAIAPVAILDRACRDQLVLPIVRWLIPRSKVDLLPRHHPLWNLAQSFGRHSMRADNHFGPDQSWSGRRAFLYGGHILEQGLLLIPMAILATLGGLIAAVLRPRQLNFATSENHP